MCLDNSGNDLGEKETEGQSQGRVRRPGSMKAPLLHCYRSTVQEQRVAVDAFKFRI